jgi:hypothetical protein
MVGNQLCGTVQGGTKNGQWYDVTCSKPMKGRSVRLVTTQRTYLSISGFEAYTGSAGSSTTTTTGGAKGGYNVPANTKAGLNNGSARQSTNYGNNSYPATNAFSGGSKFTHTNSGVGQWWEVQFN